MATAPDYVHPTWWPAGVHVSYEAPKPQDKWLLMSRFTRVGPPTNDMAQAVQTETRWAFVNLHPGGAGEMWVKYCIGHQTRGPSGAERWLVWTKYMPMRVYLAQYWRAQSDYRPGAQVRIQNERHPGIHREAQMGEKREDYQEDGLFVSSLPDEPFDMKISTDRLEHSAPNVIADSERARRVWTQRFPTAMGTPGALWLHRQR